MYRKPEVKDVVIGLVVIVAAAAIIGLIGRLTASRQPQTLPQVTVVAKMQLEMETSSQLHIANDILYQLPDGRFNQRHRMVKLYGRKGLGHEALGWTEWFDVDSAYFNVIHTDSTYYLSMLTDSTGYLVYYRAQYPVKLVRKSS